MALSIRDAEPIVAKAKAERRRFRRVRVDLAGRLFTPGDGKEARCTVLNLSPGGAAIACEITPDHGTAVVLYVDGFGRFEGAVARRDGQSFGVSFVCTPAKRERTAEQLTLFLNKALVDESLLRRHECTHQKGFAKFTRADGQIVNCEVMDISVGGVSLKSEVRPPLGEFVLVASMAGRVARHHEHGIGIEFVGQDKHAPAHADPAHKFNVVR
jgi:PilZ domain